MDQHIHNLGMKPSCLCRFTLCEMLPMHITQKGEWALWRRKNFRALTGTGLRFLRRLAFSLLAQPSERARHPAEYKKRDNNHDKSRLRPNLLQASEIQVKLYTGFVSLAMTRIPFYLSHSYPLPPPSLTSVLFLWRLTASRHVKVPLAASPSRKTRHLGI